jgi:hypothetical protein
VVSFAVVFSPMEIEKVEKDYEEFVMSLDENWMEERTER